MSTQDPAKHEEGSAFSWREPHYAFVVVVVEDATFGMQRDFLKAKSTYFRDEFAKEKKDEASGKMENVYHLDNTDREVFGYAQQFLYDGKIFEDADDIPSFDKLIAVWTLGNKLGIDGLCDEALRGLKEKRRISNHIPSTGLIVQAWEHTPEGSSVRNLVLEWAAEYMRKSESRRDFSKSLPQEVLSELLVFMSAMSDDLQPVLMTHPDPNTSVAGLSHHRNVHYLDVDGSEDGVERPYKVTKTRRSDVLPREPTLNGRKALSGRKAPARASLPNMKQAKNRRASTIVPSNHQWTTPQRMKFCSDLLDRMLSGPGFWTRLVGPFREPVRPVEDNIPDYFEKITTPMDLGTIRRKINQKEYMNEEEFAADVRQIFTNAYTYWKEGDTLWSLAKKFEKQFEEKFSAMDKWLAKMEKDEAAQTPE